MPACGYPGAGGGGISTPGKFANSFLMEIVFRRFFGLAVVMVEAGAEVEAAVSHATVFGYHHVLWLACPNSLVVTLLAGGRTGMPY